ncbi:hypothetical protein BOX15_Mlig008661g1 [Macrostomum lignano]|uniref:Phospholipid scramblase n=1 Tax=Macrostomum lignano TaxID=282301 RepID=A0A267GNA2_9PLAT|nr:hypothetical protein BOX15_Mlig008661g1 [Macrostomum lignano]
MAGRVNPAFMQQQQQQPENWMPKPSGGSDCPPGLEYLTQLDQVLVKQKKEFFEMVTGWETKNKYVVRNSMGQQIYYAKEHSDNCQRQCCGNQRAFEMTVEDNTGQEVIHISRPYKCMCYGQCFSCSKCCFDTVTVEAPPGRVAGKVKQIYGCCEAKYKIEDKDGDTVLYIDGPSYCKCYCPGDDIPFKLVTKDREHEIGRVSKQWSNLLQEYFTDADNFGITFPKDLHLDAKATIIGACFLIDFMFFERSGNNRRR